MRCFLAIGLTFTVVTEAQAYLGPGLGGGALGVIVGLLGSIGLALIAVFWYPLKRLLRRLFESHNNSDAQYDEDRVSNGDEVDGFLSQESEELVAQAPGTKSTAKASIDSIQSQNSPVTLDP